MREAVTAVFVYGEELFVIERQPYLRAFPGYLAFPGGKVDALDQTQTPGHAMFREFPDALTQALQRELIEEVGYDLMAAAGSGELSSVSLLGTAVTPAFESVRFSAHHFKIVLNRRPEFRPDREEIAWSGWVHRSELWRRYAEGEALMVTPTINLIRSLAQDIRTTRVEPFNLEYDSACELPYLELIKGVGSIPVPSTTLPPAQATNALVLGDPGQPVCLVDPSPRDEETYQKLLRTLRRYPVERLLISHHHPDHHQFAPRLARELGLPLLCSERTRERLLQSCGRDYLAGISLVMVEEGSLVTRWLGREVHCYHLPGHDDGMIGLAPEDHAWFFVCDLIQTAGSVVIPEPEGDMQAYFDSLQRVISLDPGVIIPSHGMPVGTRLVLERVLEHRRQREASILEMLEDGLSQQQMLEQIYAGLDAKLLPLAQQNLRQHMRKLGLSIRPSGR